MVVNKQNDDAGFFGYIGPGGVPMHVNVIDGKVEGTYWTGGIAGRNSTGSTIENCYNTAYVATDDGFIHNIGGITGKNETGSVVDNCYHTGYVDGDGNVTNNVGAIAGQNDGSSTVRNCYYEEGSVYRGEMSNGSGQDGVGTSAETGTVEKAKEKTEDEFKSGEVAWELSQGNNGGWGQNLTGESDDVIDNHPHFIDMSDKPVDTTPVYRVTFHSYITDKSTGNVCSEIDRNYYVDPGENFDIPSFPELTLPEIAKWYVNGEEFDGRNIEQDIDAVAGLRIFFSGVTDTATVEGTYSPAGQTLAVNLDQYVEYEDNDPLSEGKFEYKLIYDADSLKAELSEDGRTLAIPAGTPVKEDGYKLTITAREIKPYISDRIPTTRTLTVVERLESAPGVHVRLWYGRYNPDLECNHRQGCAGAQNNGLRY